MHKKERIRVTKDINCKNMFLNEWSSYIMECRALTANQNPETNRKFLEQLEETKKKLEAFAHSPDTLSCEEGTMEELVCMLEKLRLEELDQLLNGFNMHIKIVKALAANEKNEKDKALMDNTVFDCETILSHLVRIFGVTLVEG